MIAKCVLIIVALLLVLVGVSKTAASRFGEVISIDKQRGLSNPRRKVTEEELIIHSLLTQRLRKPSVFGRYFISL